MMPPKRQRTLSTKAAELAKSARVTKPAKPKPAQKRLRSRVVHLPSPKPSQQDEGLVEESTVAEPVVEAAMEVVVEPTDESMIEVRPVTNVESALSSSQAQSTQPPATLSYNVSWIIRFEEVVLQDNSQPGEVGKDYLDDMFDPYMFATNCLSLADKYATKEGYRNILISAKVSIHPFSSRRKPVTVDWTSFGDTIWQKSVLQIAENYANEAKRSARAPLPTVSIGIEVIYARHQDWQQPIPSSSGQATKKRDSTTNRMLTDLQSNDSQGVAEGVLTIHKRWKCSDSGCMASRGGLPSICYVRDSTHYRVPMRRITDWADRIATKSATVDKLPSDILKYCGPAGRVVPKASKASKSDVIGGQPAWPGMPFMMPPQYSMYPYAMPPHNVQTSAAFKPVSPTSSPPLQDEADPDGLVQLFFKDMIQKNPLQTDNLQAASALALKEGATINYLWEWSSQHFKISNKRLDSIGDGLRRRIHDSVKPFMLNVGERRGLLNRQEREQNEIQPVQDEMRYDHDFDDQLPTSDGLLDSSQ